MILLWGLPGEEPLEAVRAGLQRVNARHVLLDERAALATRVRVDAGAAVGGRLDCGDTGVRLDDVRGAYLRPYGTERAFAGAAHRSAADRAHADAISDL